MFDLNVRHAIRQEDKYLILRYDNETGAVNPNGEQPMELTTAVSYNSIEDFYAGDGLESDHEYQSTFPSPAQVVARLEAGEDFVFVAGVANTDYLVILNNRLPELQEKIPASPWVFHPHYQPGA